MRSPASPAQLPLFQIGPVMIHIRRWSQPVGIWICAWCRADLAAAAAWDQIGGCHDCPGYVEPAPSWALLAADEEPEHLASEAAA